MGCLCVWSIAYAQNKINRYEAPTVSTQSNTAPDDATNKVVVKTNNVHSIRSVSAISSEALRGWLEQNSSPLAPYSDRILDSPYWATIIGICAAEEYNCSVNPHETNNLWGIMCSGSLCHYSSLAAGIVAIDDYLDHRNDQGLDTIEKFRTQNLGNGKFRAIYCYERDVTDHICWGWERKVLQVKIELESL